MAWEQRGGRHYYYRSHKIDGRVVKEYFVAGAAGMLAEREDETRRQQREAEREALRRERQMDAVAIGAHINLSDATDALMTAALIAAGFHRHDRGQWRKRHASQAGE